LRSWSGSRDCKGLQAPAGGISSRPVWITSAHKRIQLPLIAFRLSQDQQHKAERRTKRKASKNQQQVQPNTLYFAGWVLVVTPLPQQHWSDEQILGLYQARWQIERLFKRINHLLQRQSLSCKTAATAKATLTLLLLGWALLEEESAAVRLAMREAMQATWPSQEGTLLGLEGTNASCWQEDLGGPSRLMEAGRSQFRSLLPPAARPLYCRALSRVFAPFTTLFV
jgi:hypothetical protein